MSKESLTEFFVILKKLCVRKYWEHVSFACAFTSLVLRPESGWFYYSHIVFDKFTCSGHFVSVVFLDPNLDGWYHRILESCRFQSYSKTSPPRLYMRSAGSITHMDSCLPFFSEPQKRMTHYNICFASLIILN